MSRAIEKTIEVNATPEKLWRVFTDPLITRQMGGEYVTDWKVGSSFRWKGLDGNLYTNGKILQLEPAKILQHNLFNPDEEEKVLSVITYKLDGNEDATTTLYAKEELAVEMTDEEFEQASESWGFALKLVKEKAESL